MQEAQIQKNSTERMGNSFQKIGLSGSTLKIIAMISMLIDHFGAVVVARMVLQFWELEQLVPYDGLWKVFPWLLEPDSIYTFYSVLRCIGRIAFPIYCFLLVEGFQKTGNRKKYALRLGLFAVLSEVPFDLALQSTPFGWEYQNVFFTLLIALLTMMLCDWAAARRWSADIQRNKIGMMAVCDFFIVSGCILAELVRSDYGARGILCIMVLYVFRKVRSLQAAAGAVSFFWELPAPLAFIPIAFYNGQKGLNLKYFFYVFYPLHLIVLWYLCILLGIEGISTI